MTQPTPDAASSSRAPLVVAALLLLTAVPAAAVARQLVSLVPIPLGLPVLVVALLLPPAAATAVLARGWTPLCGSGARAARHALALVVGSVAFGGGAGFVSGAVGVSGSTDVGVQLGAVLLGVAVALLAPSVLLGILGAVTRNRLLAARGSASPVPA